MGGLLGTSKLCPRGVSAYPAGMEKTERQLYEEGKTYKQVGEIVGLCASHAGKRIRQQGGVPRIGGRAKGYKHSKETCAKMSAARREQVARGVKTRVSSWLPPGEFSDKGRLNFVTYYTKHHGREMLQDGLHPSHFIRHFYTDEQFNAVYDAWERSGCNSWWRPSLDHIVPKALGGRWSLENLRYVTWWENRTKNNMRQPEWLALRGNLPALFVENIVVKRKSANAVFDAARQSLSQARVII